ncbi:MAG: tRNA (adenosine(37)-N6)-threonylcarbamoyltransferase complex dimerization subunit type 1 TsaB, partial [Rhodobacteraceae bacterium]
MLLVLDAAGDRCAAALFAGDAPVAWRDEAMTRGHAERLMPMIAEVFEEAAASPRALDAIVVCTGPGSFAGARIGVAAARGLALSTGAAAIGVSWFDALGARTAGAVLVRLAHGQGVAIQRFRDRAAVSAARLVSADDPAAEPAADERLDAGAEARGGVARLGLLAAAARQRAADGA